MYRNEDIGFIIKLIGDAIETKANQKLKHYDMTLSQGRVLSYLHHRRGMKTSQRDMEEYFQVTHPTIIGILKRLESKGLITSEYDTVDKRIKNVYLTRDHESKSIKASDFQVEMEETLVRGFTAEQISELKEALFTLYRNIENEV